MAENSMNGPDYANAALGVYSLVKGLSTKKPKKLTPTPFQAVIRPAQGDIEGLQRAKNEIAQQADSAGRDITRIAGSDVNSGLQARLGVQANASKASVDAEANNSNLLRADQLRVSQEQNNQNLINNQLTNEANQVNNQVARDQYNATQNAARAGIQSALQYETNRAADNKNKAVQENQSNQFIDAADQAHWYETYNAGLSRGLSTEESKAQADEALKTNSLGSMKTNFYGKRNRVRVVQ